MCIRWKLDLEVVCQAVRIISCPKLLFIFREYVFVVYNPYLKGSWNLTLKKIDQKLSYIIFTCKNLTKYKGKIIYGVVEFDIYSVL